MSPLPRIGPADVVYENRHQRIARLRAEFPGVTKEFYVTEFGERVGVVAVRSGEVLLVRQYRLLQGGLSWEVPGGGLDPGESPEEAARRECLEEAGIAIRGLEPLLGYQLGLDTLWNPTYLYWTGEFEEQPHRPVRGEVAERAWVALPRVLEMIRRGEIVDSMSLLAILAYRLRREDGDREAAEQWAADREARFPARRPTPPSREARSRV